jgi:hypothetical protein
MSLSHNSPDSPSRITEGRLSWAEPVLSTYADGGTMSFPHCPQAPGEISSDIRDKLPYYNCYKRDWVLHGRECIRANAKPLRRPQSLSSAAWPATSSFGGESGVPATPAKRRPESLSALTACPEGGGSSSSRDCQDSALAYRVTVQTGCMKFASSQPSIRPTATIGMSTSMLTYADVC